jgi:hypothetical protein
MASRYFEMVFDAVTPLQPLLLAAQRRLRPGRWEGVVKTGAVGCVACGHAADYWTRGPAALLWDSTLTGCVGGVRSCNGVHLVCRGNNLLNVALLAQLWPAWQRGGAEPNTAEMPARAPCAHQPLDETDVMRAIETGVGVVAPSPRGWPPLLVCPRRTRL